MTTLLLHQVRDEPAVLPLALEILALAAALVDGKLTVRRVPRLLAAIQEYPVCRRAAMVCQVRALWMRGAAGLGTSSPELAKREVAWLAPVAHVILCKGSRK